MQTIPSKQSSFQQHQQKHTTETKKKNIKSSMQLIQGNKHPQSKNNHPTRDFPVKAHSNKKKISHANNSKELMNPVKKIKTCSSKNNHLIKHQHKHTTQTPKTQNHNSSKLTKPQ